jgi:hypothetical protein
MSMFKVGAWEVSWFDSKLAGFLHNNLVILLYKHNNEVVVSLGLGVRENKEYISYKQKETDYYLVVDYKDKTISVLQAKGTLPYGVTVDELTVQYGEGILECGIKTSSEQGQSCGGSGGRLGCWTCGMTSGNDPMLMRYIAAGENYE